MTQPQLTDTERWREYAHDRAVAVQRAKDVSLALAQAQCYLVRPTVEQLSRVVKAAVLGPKLSITDDTN